MPVRLGTTIAEEFALPKVKEGLSQLILEQKTCYDYRDRPGLETDMAIVTMLVIETDMAIVTALVIETNMAIVTVLASKPTWHS